ncbi:MAG: hypothetical protein ACKOEE_13115 [Tagaea sp.]|nr:hypothetical protein [Azospirillum sp.]MCA3265411.1 hypothetical protein [Azospirillum sp.]MCZ8122512.1 hypothetical protein [Magnetospirillum sp.]
MAAQTFQVALHPVAGLQCVIVNVDPASVSTPEMQKRTIGYLAPRFQGKQLVLMYLDLARRPVFLGPGHIVGALQGKGFSEFRWQKAVLQ